MSPQQDSGYAWIGRLMVTDRGVSEYSRALGLDVGMLRGKDVLDIGAGAGAFGKECSKLGINVVSLDPAYSLLARPAVWREYGDMDISEHLRGRENRNNKVAGMNEALSFRSGSFDFALSTFSSYFFIPDNYPPERHYEIFKLLTREVVRVLKPGGEARVGQMANGWQSAPLLDEMIAEGSAFEYEMVPETDHFKAYMRIRKK